MQNFNDLFKDNIDGFMKKKLCFLIFGMICFTSFSLLGEETDHRYQLRIGQIHIDHESKKPHTAGEIILDNGSVWEWSPCICCGKKLDSWKEGDRVKIANTLKNKYYMENLSRKFVPTVALKNDSQDVFPEIVEISDNGQKILLSDHSEWHIGWWSAQWAKYWKVGERVIITPVEAAFGEATHVIFNIQKEKTLFNDCSYINATLLN